MSENKTVTVYKTIQVFNNIGSLIATIPYKRKLNIGLITALGAQHDNLDNAILDAIRNIYHNSRFYNSEELTEEQIQTSLEQYEGGEKKDLLLVLIHSQVFQIKLVLRLSKYISVDECNSFAPIIEQKVASVDLIDLKPEVLAFEAL